ncbi:MAG: O-antigen ligase family protein [Patescibacteria group bacterium]|jgi:O-antigen ligase
MFKKIIKNSYLYLFYAFLFTIPFQKRHIFNLATAKIGDIFVEWQTITIYASDILFALCLIFWVINLILVKTKKQENHPTGDHSKGGNKTNPFIFILPIAIFFFSLISVFVNYNNYLDHNVAIFRMIKLAEFILLIIFIILNLNTKKRLISAIYVLITSGVLSSILVIIQYLKQQTLGLTILGEPLVLPVLQNVAKIVLDNGNVIMRAYGTFPHPNVLAGFLLASMVILIGLMIYQLNNYGLDKPKYRILTILLSFGLILEFIAFIFTFSRTAWIAFVIALAILVISLRKKIVIALNNIKTNSFYHPFIIIILAIIFIIVAQWPQITARAAIADQNGDKAVSNRAFYNQISFNMIKSHPFFGIGYNNFTSQMSKYTNQKIEWWQYQPAHNIYLLIFAESGIFSLLSFLGLIIVISYQLSAFAFASADKQVNSSIFNFVCFSILVAFLFIALFDHYLWTIQQGQLLFWLVLGLTATKINQQKIEK